MSNTTFIPRQTLITSDWLNDVNDAVYEGKNISGLTAINVKAPPYSAVGDGVADDTAAIQSAIDTGKTVYLPNGIYKLTSPLTISTTGQRIYGESKHNTYFTGGVNHDQLRIAASLCIVENIHFRPAGYSDASAPTFAPIRVYAAFCKITNNRFLAAGDQHGTAILVDDVNPATAAVINGAYTHTIAENSIGATGFTFKYGVYFFGNNNGQQANKVQNNHIIATVPIYTYKGGGNYYVGNLLQSASAGFGNGIDLQADVTGETITGNYIERFQFGVIIRRTTQDYIAANIYGNHWDNNTTNITSVSSNMYAYFDELAWYDYKNTWQWRYGSQDNAKLINREGVEVLNVNRASFSVEPRVLAHNNTQAASVTSNGTTVTPVSSWMTLTGAGAARTGCFLGNGTRSGQHLYIRAYTWAVEILNNPGGTQNIVFDANAASATFGNGAGNVICMHLIWDASYAAGVWFEQSRTTV